MIKSRSALARKQLDRRLSPIRAIDLTPPTKGWIRAVRDSLEMTAGQLAERMGVARSRVFAIEKAEVADATTLRSLRQAAAALNCRLVYALVPIEPLDDIVSNRVRKKIDEDIRRIDHTMRLENQAISAEDLDAERDRAYETYMSESLRRVWGDHG